jgi:prepilin-type N-terminal cleavage/methylation domain-containing protein
VSLRRLRNSQAGDTIIEVLIATAIVGLAIALAYGVANRSIRAARQAQERVEAVKIAETQLESMKAIASNEDPADDSKVFDDNRLFCIGTDNERKNFSAWTTAPALDADPLSASDYPVDCVQGEGSRYHVSVKATELSGAVSPRYQFTVTVRWFGFGNLRKEQTVVEYRLHP